MNAANFICASVWVLQQGHTVAVTHKQLAIILQAGQDATAPGICCSIATCAGVHVKGNNTQARWTLTLRPAPSSRSAWHADLNFCTSTALSLYSGSATCVRKHENLKSTKQHNRTLGEFGDTVSPKGQARE